MTKEKPKEKLIPISFKLGEEDHKKLTKLADKNIRTVTAEIKIALSAHLKKAK
jgi:hypothetical protein